jgi:hypothetical protein
MDTVGIVIIFRQKGSNKNFIQLFTYLSKYYNFLLFLIKKVLTCSENTLFLQSYLQILLFL